MDVEATIALFWQAGLAIGIAFIFGFVIGLTTMAYLNRGTSKGKKKRHDRGMTWPFNSIEDYWNNWRDIT